MQVAAVWQHSSNSNIKIVRTSIEHFLWNPSDFFSGDVLSCLRIVFTNSVFQVALQKIVRWVEILGMGWLEVIGFTRDTSAAWEVFPLDRLISRKTDNSRPYYSQDLNLPDYFLGGTWKAEFEKTIHRQERTSSEEKSEGFHKKCSKELWTILMFDLLLCCHTAATVHGTNIVLITENV